jgi:hypothetical protein
MNKLRAVVRELTGATKHTVASPEGPVPCAVPSYVVIDEQEGAFYLLRYSGEGECVADTWHVTVDEAKAQAEFEYGIKERDWTATD